ncbi:aminoacyl-tRNA hydrolase, partial [Bacillus cereus]|nr:aminoacyl-tRNA hydrolase [Bacillus cereus]
MRRNQNWLRLFVTKKESSGTRMKSIGGLGNPGRENEITRHNIGSMAIDEIATRSTISLNDQTIKGVFGAAFVNEEKVIVLKPPTYMNLSGESI